ncbi:MAG: sugar-binding domain-containing protein, partial [Oscillospiraceae bacterium]
FVAPSAENDAVTNRTLAAGAIDYLRELGGNRFGIGWGTIIGELVSLLEQEQPEPSSLQSICPLVGNSGVSNRNYHSNENVRIFAWQSMAQPQYLYAPAFAENQQELDLIQRMESCQAVYTAWESLDLALVNIGNYPSTPDFASGARYGDLLSKRKAAGRLLAYYFDVHGDIIRSDTDYAIQIPTQLLGRCKNVVGICSANVKPRALAGALRTGLIHHLVASEELVRAASEYRGL